MADIFISYSKPDRDKVVVLAAYLESEGWTVWWDTSLAVGDAYRDEIMKQLAAARAVIVLWTQNSSSQTSCVPKPGERRQTGSLSLSRMRMLSTGTSPSRLARCTP